MTKESTADYGVALSASAVGQANLAKQTQAFTRNLVLSQAQNQLAAEALAKRGAASVAKVGQQQASATSRYGGALGESAAAAFKQAQATANASADQLTGLSRLAGRNVRTAQVVAGIAKAGVAAQSAAAQYSLNQALQQRAIIDNQTLASLTGDLYKSALDYNMQWTMWKRQQDYAAKLAEREGGESSRASAEAMMAEGPGLAAGAADAWREYRDEWYEPDGTLKDDAPKFDITAAAQAYAVENGYSLESPQMALYISTLRNIKNGANADEAFSEAMNSLFSTTKGWDKWGPGVITSGMLELQREATAARVAYFASLAAEESGVSGSGTTGVPWGAGVLAPETAPAPYSGR
jgi:hypothetical protein